MSEPLDIREYEAPETAKLGPLTTLEWDAEVVIEGLVIRRLLSRNSSREETWYFAEGHVSVHATKYPDKGAIETFTGWRVSYHSGAGPRCESRADALRRIPAIARQRAEVVVAEALAALEQAMRVSARIEAARQAEAK